MIDDVKDVSSYKEAEEWKTELDREAGQCVPRTAQQTEHLNKLLQRTTTKYANIIYFVLHGSIIIIIMNYIEELINITSTVYHYIIQIVTTCI